MSKRIMLVLLLPLALGIAACTTIPTGPSRMALPGGGKSFDQFRADDATCRQYALENSGATPQQIQEVTGVKAAAIGTAIGAAAGAAIGGTGRDAGVGAGVGLITGAMAGAGAGERSGQMMQRRYDDGYTQCMYAKGHRVAVPAGSVYTQPGGGTSQPQSQPYGAPPPPGSAPPPPASIMR